MLVRRFKLRRVTLKFTVIIWSMFRIKLSSWAFFYMFHGQLILSHGLKLNRPCLHVAAVGDGAPSRCVSRAGRAG